MKIDKKPVHTVVLPEELNEKYRKIVEQRGMSKSQTIRFTLRQALCENINMPALACYIVSLSEHVRRNKGKLSDKEYSDMTDAIENMIKLLESGGEWHDCAKHNQKPGNGKRCRKGSK